MLRRSPLQAHAVDLDDVGLLVGGVAELGGVAVDADAARGDQLLGFAPGGDAVAR